MIKLKSSFVCLKRTSQPYKNFIEFPGGKKKNNETATQCLRREIKEELNIKIDKSKFETSQFVEYKQQFQIFILLALLFIIVDIFIFQTKTKWIQNLNLFNENEE